MLNTHGYTMKQRPDRIEKKTQSTLTSDLLLCDIFDDRWTLPVWNEK